MKRCRIASFNMKNWSLRTNHDLDRIAQIIRENQFDIVAMQEVLAEGRAISWNTISDPSARKRAYEKSLLGRLGKHWESHWDMPKAQSDTRGEGYAFVWNTRKFDFMRDENAPKIYEHYKAEIKGENINFRLVRDPLYGRFKMKNSKIELRLITTHIIFDEPKEGNLPVDFDGGAVALRRHEFELLAGRIYAQISDYRKDVRCTVPYTLILGDYNLNLESSGIRNDLKDIVCFTPEGRMVADGAPGCREMYTVQSKPSTLGGANYANNYDHFSFDDRVRRQVRSYDRIDAVHQGEKSEDQTEEEKFKRFKETVSDHVPVVIELDF